MAVSGAGVSNKKAVMSIKNIIFDLHGVLFTTAQPGGEKHFHVIEEGVQLLKDCKQSHAAPRIFACTNWSPAKVEQLHQEHPLVMSHFEGVVTAAQAQARKPDPAIFQYLFKQYSLQAGETIFIDDQYDNVIAAQQLGISSFHLQDAENFQTIRSQLKHLIKPHYLE